MSAGKGSQKFAQLVAERTNGAVVVKLFPNSQLGNEKDMAEQVQIGGLEMQNVSSGMLASFDGWQALGVLGMPYVFCADTEAEQYPILAKLVRGPEFSELAEQAAQASGIRALDLGWWYGQRHLTTGDVPVKTLADLQGLKIRTPNAPVQELAMRALGAAVTPMAFPELYTALQTGVVDGQENPVDTTYNAKFHEVQRYLTLTGHMTQHEAITINEKVYQSLPPDIQAILVQAAIEAGDYQSELQLEANRAGLELLKAEGMEVTAPDLTEFRDKTKDAWKEFESQFGSELYETVRAASC